MPGLPFGFDLGAVDFAQLTRMLQSSGPVNWEVARTAAEWMATEGEPEPMIAPATRAELEDLARAAQSRVADATGITEVHVARVEVLDRRGWVTRHERALRPVLEALATRFGALLDAGAHVEDLEGVDLEAWARELGLPSVPGITPIPPEMMANLLPQLAPLLLGLQVGSMLGYLAQHALGRYDWALPSADEPTMSFVARNLDDFGREWSLPATDLRFCVALHEAIHAAVRSRAWVRELDVALATGYVGAYDLDADVVERAFGDLDPSDPETIRRLAASPERLLGAMQSERQLGVLRQLQDFHALLGAYAAALLENLATPLVPTLHQILEAIRRHRLERGEAERFVEGLLGAKIDRAADERADAFCAGVVERAGVAGLDRLWDRASMLPTPPELEAPGLWLARIELDDTQEA